ncbi:PP2C family protein-serine/threonine phosphatase [Streptomyces zingiberis]|uniref:PP2C family protein-serine/threonine phosphatase n=1 Tax=Streptomyces zingiberis TaxID=2053010 RepID=UPI0028930731|nr:PP2C family protein-serine/threonine phosphatase [Streptomyces zingiberis]
MNRLRPWAADSAGPAGRVRRALLAALPGLWVVGIAGWELFRTGGPRLAPLLAAAPAIACAGSGRRSCVVGSGVAALAAYLLLGQVGDAPPAGVRAGACGAVVTIVVAAYLATGRRQRLLRELERAGAVAVAAQEALLRPPPAALGGYTTAARHLSATRGATVGGDLYEAVVTPYGPRVVIGDVRGHGLDAVGTVAALLGCFREAAHDEPDLAGVLRRLDRALTRHLRERGAVSHERAQPGGAPDGAGEAPDAEEFVTVLLLELCPAGTGMTVLNCGHPWPYRVHAGHRRGGGDGGDGGDGGESPDGAGGGDATRDARPGGGRVLPDGPCATGPVEQLSEAEPLPPLGAFPLPDPLPVLVLPAPAPGELLLLHTDGAEEARDTGRRFFPLADVLAAAAAAGAMSPAEIVERVQSALLRHTGGRLTDDVALLALRQDGPRVPAARTAGGERGGAGAGRAEAAGHPWGRPPGGSRDTAGPADPAPHAAPAAPVDPGGPARPAVPAPAGPVDSSGPVLSPGSPGPAGPPPPPGG